MAVDCALKALKRSKVGHCNRGRDWPRQSIGSARLLQNVCAGGANISIARACDRRVRATISPPPSLGRLFSQLAPSAVLS